MVESEVSPGETQVSGSRGVSPKAAWLVASGLGLLLLTLSLGLAVLDEPYHIDELRQVSYYDLTFSEVAESALTQDQPPLDYWIGKAIRLIIGRPSDAGERLPAAAFSLAAALGISGLLFWSGRLSVVWVPLSIAGLSPLFLAFGAYARPYALPLALMVGFIVSADWWRRARRWPALLFTFLTASVLPLSRTVEPLLFLAAVSVLLGSLLIVNRSERWAMPVLIASGVGLVVAVPITRLLSTATADFQSESLNDISVVGHRWQEAFGVIASGMPLGLVMLGVSVIIAAFVVRQLFRRGPTDMWWFLPLLTTPIASVFLFGLVANPGVPFFERYGFFFVLPLAAGVALASARLEARTTSRTLRLAVLGMLAVSLFALGVPATVRALSTTQIPDYRAAALAVNDELAGGTVVLYDDGTTVEEYRNPYFPGSPRYTYGLPVRESSTVARFGQPLEDGPLVVLSRGERLSAVGWSAFSIGDDFVIYLPQSVVRWGEGDLGVALQSLCEAGDIKSYGYLCVVAAQAYDASGDHVAAGALMESTAARASEAGVIDRFGLSFD
jgi:hypothetical protein